MTSNKNSDKEEIVNEVFIKCECGAHMLMVTSYVNSEWLPEGTVEIAFWEQGKYVDGSFSQKLRQIWRILRYGHPYGDFICLNSKERKNLIEALSLAKEKES